MMNGISPQGLLVFTALMSLLLSILWLPTIYQLRKLQIQLKSKTAFFLLSIELIAVIIIVLISDFIGLSNPAGLIIASTISISTFTFLMVKFYGTKFS